jgi:hypothetical protein
MRLIHTAIKRGTLQREINNLAKVQASILKHERILSKLLDDFKV